MALKLQDNGTGRKDQNESLDLLSGADDCILIRATETFDADAQDCTILAIVVNEAAVIGSLIANDSDSTDVVGGGLVKGYKNIDGQTLCGGCFLSPGKYEYSRGWSSVTVTTGSVFAYYKYKPTNK